MADRDGASSAASPSRPSDGRVAIISGANTGIGLETAASLAAAGAKTVLACRNDERAAAARAELLRRHSDRRRGAAAPRSRLICARSRTRPRRRRIGSRQIHLIVNNAGLITRSRSVTVDGFETTFGVNHLGHFAWTGHLLPALLAAPDSRVVTVSSLAHLQATMRWDDLMGDAGSSRSPPTGARRSRTFSTAPSSNARLTVRCSGASTPWR